MDMDLTDLTYVGDWVYDSKKLEEHDEFTIILDLYVILTHQSEFDFTFKEALEVARSKYPECPSMFDEVAVQLYVQMSDM